MKWMVLGLLVF